MPAPAGPAAPPADKAPEAAPAFAAGGSSFGDAAAAVADEANLQIKLYGDMGLSARNNENWQWARPAMATPGTYSPGIPVTFNAPRIDLFASADVGKLSFLTEVLFEAFNNNVGVDIERMQLAYLVANWLRLKAGRSHLAWGYYNDTYHHGSLFELTTQRPYSVEFEDSGGLLLSHNVGIGADGTFDLGGGGQIRYDLDVGNGRPADVTGVAMEFAESPQKAVNARLRWMPVDGLIVGVNGMREVIPQLPGAGTAPARPEVEEMVGGAHVAYGEHDFRIDIEGFYMHHAPNDGEPSSDIYGGFAELGYALGAFTPYVRPEYVRFPDQPDIVYQFNANSAQAQLIGAPSLYDATKDFLDLRVGVKWMPLPQVALKLEGQRASHDAQHQEVVTAKVAFGF